LRLLAGWVSKDLEQPGDIRACRHLDVFEDLVQRQHHVLEQSYESLNPERRLLLGKIACFRSPVTYQVLVAVAEIPPAPPFGRGESHSPPFQGGLGGLNQLRSDLFDLLDRGLLQRDRRTNRFDLHPIVRRYAYDRLSSSQRTSAHHQLRDYFAAIPTPERVQTLDELNPAMELYHHLVGAGEYDEAWQIYYERIWKAIYYQFGAYQLEIELLRALFPQGESQPPQLSSEGTRAWTLNSLANSYSLSGQPAQAVPMFQQAAAIYEAREDKLNWAINLGNLALDQVRIGALQSAESNLRRRIALCQEIGDEFEEAVGHRELGLLLAYRGAWDESETELAAALALFEKEEYIQSQGLTWAYKSQRSLLFSRAASDASQQQQAVVAALAQARQALELAEERARTLYPYARDFVRAYWLLGAAECANGNLEESDTHLTEALTRCRTINAVDAEADILLDLARLRVIPPSPPLEGGNRIQSASLEGGNRIQSASLEGGNRIQNLPSEVENQIQNLPSKVGSLTQSPPFEGGFRGISEALAIAERSGYVLQQADIHLFLAQLAQQEGDGEKARFHARHARQFTTCDGGEFTYKVVYEAAMNFM
jgi:tetratricopeptide (TPR) repeat protein